MNKSRSLELLCAGVVAAALGACSSTPPASGTAPAPTGGLATTSPGSASSKTAPAGASTVSTVMLAPHRDPANVLYKEHSVFFGYDDFTIRDSDAAVVERHGRYLAGHPELSVRIEGNADERGSSEYNLSLGQKRAEAALRAMQISGAKAAQMEPVSYGKERPRAAGHDEAAWAQNRRADIVYRN